LLSLKFKAVHSFNQPVLASISARAIAHSSQMLFFSKFKAVHSFNQPVFISAWAIAFTQSDQI
jgi:hypothetical protein